MPTTSYEAVVARREHPDRALLAGLYPPSSLSTLVCPDASESDSGTCPVYQDLCASAVILIFKKAVSPVQAISLLQLISEIPDVYKRVLHLAPEKGRVEILSEAVLT